MATLVIETVPVSIFSDLSLEATQAAMDALVIPSKRPNAKLAWWFAVCSIQTSVERNCQFACVLRAYADSPLPVNRDELRAQLKGVMTSQLNTLYEIERLSNEGIIHFNCGTTFESQSIWRRTMCAAIPGMGEKTVSFALHIYNPAGCQLFTIDVWHIRRILGKFNLTHKENSIRTKQYLAYEQELLDDCRALQDCESNGKKYWLVSYAACLWERTRRYYGRTKVGSGYTDHSGLSCYV